MTIFELLSIMEKTLVKAKISFANLDAEVLLACALKTNRSYLLSHGSDTVSPAIKKRAEGLLKRRLCLEPIAYIRGYQPFYGRDFKVNKQVLIPRPETELIIEKLTQELPVAWNGTFIDLGTGSGVLAITLALNFPQAQIFAIDKSAQALKVARVNARFHQVSKKIKFIKSDLLNSKLLSSGLRNAVETIDLRGLRAATAASLRENSTEFSRASKNYCLKKAFISTSNKQITFIVNLPYVPTNAWRNTETQVKKYEPRVAIDGGKDGLKLYSRLFQQLKKIGFTPTALWCEIDSSQKHLFPLLISKFFPNAISTIYKDLNNHSRLAHIHF